MPQPSPLDSPTEAELSSPCGLQEMPSAGCCPAGGCGKCPLLFSMQPEPNPSRALCRRLGTSSRGAGGWQWPCSAGGAQCGLCAAFPAAVGGGTPWGQPQGPWEWGGTEQSHSRNVPPPLIQGLSPFVALVMPSPSLGVFQGLHPRCLGLVFPASHRTQRFWASPSPLSPAGASCPEQVSLCAWWGRSSPILPLGISFGRTANP